MINTHMRDLLETLLTMPLNEAPVKPGERKEISFKLKKLESMTSKLDAYKRSLYSMENSTLPPELQKDMDALYNKLDGEIKKVQTAYDEMYEKSIAASGRPIKMDNVFKALAKNCKEIVKVYKELNRNSFTKQRFMYRGIKSSADALYGKPFDARKPKDSNVDLHELVNDTINSLGFEANRGNAMFVTGDRSQASGYGSSLYVMFPVDGFTYTWSQVEKDLVLDSGKRLSLIDKEVASKIRGAARLAKEKDSTIPISYPDDLFTSGYDYESDVENLSSLVERGFLPKEVKTLLDELLTDSSIQEYFKFTDKNLFQAIASNKEIYLRGDYYAINIDYMTDLIEFLKDIDVDSVELPESFGEAPTILEQGDIVKIISGPYEGKKATITYSFSDRYEVKFQENEEATVEKAQVELYTLPDGSTPSFKEGQRVIVTNPDSYLYGSTLKINWKYSSGKMEATDEQGTTREVWASELTDYSPELEKELENVPKPHQFKRDEYAKVIDSESTYYDQVGKVTYFYSNGKIELTFPGGIEVSFTRNQLDLASESDYKKLGAASDKADLKVGDKVKVIGGPHVVNTGTIEYLYTAYEDATVKLDNGETVDIELQNLQKIEDPTDVPSTEGSSLQVGDTVKVVNAESSYYGLVGKVIETGGDLGPNPWAKVASGNYEFKTFTSWLEKADSQSEFKAGDKIKIVWSDSMYNGKVATIIGGPDEDDDYQVSPLGSNSMTYVPASGMEKLEDTQATFKVGDMVKMVDPDYDYYGEIGVIDEGPDMDGEYLVSVDGESSWYQPNQIVKIDQPESSETFTVGDKAKVIDSSSSLVGKTVTLLKGPDEDGDFTVVVDSGAVVYMHPNQLEKIDSASSTSADSPTINVYDTVENIKSGHPNFGQLGKVQTVYSSGNIGLVYSDNTQAIDPPSYLKKVDGPPSPTQAPFKVGDRIEVSGEFPSLIGMTGTVTQVSPNYEFVSVQIDGNTEASSFPVSALKKSTAPKATEELHLGDTVKVTNTELTSHGIEGKIVNMDDSIITMQYGDQPSDVFFVKKSSVKKIG
jgi:transcription antitermination factor NusG